MIFIRTVSNSYYFTMLNLHYYLLPYQLYRISSSVLSNSTRLLIDVYLVILTSNLVISFLYSTPTMSRVYSIEVEGDE